MSKVINRKNKLNNVPVNSPITLYTKPLPSLPAYKCPYCESQWMPRKNRPKVCPTCHRILPWPVAKRGRPVKHKRRK